MLEGTQVVQAMTRDSRHVRIWEIPESPVLMLFLWKCKTSECTIHWCHQDYPSKEQARVDNEELATRATSGS